MKLLHLGGHDILLGLRVSHILQIHRVVLVQYL